MNTKPKLMKNLALLSLASLLGFSTTHAATITWSVGPISTTDGDESDVSTWGDLVEAVNFGAATTSTTINTVTFEAFTDIGNNHTTDNLSTLVDQSADSNFYTDGNTSYDTLLDGFIFDTLASEITYTLTGLGIGNVYEVQLFLADDRTNLSLAYYDSYLSVDGSGSSLGGNSTVFGGDANPALVFTGTFTADASTQTFTAQSFEDDNTNRGTQLNAYQLRTIPEPSSTALLGLGGLAFMLRRKRS